MDARLDRLVPLLGGPDEAVLGLSEVFGDLADDERFRGSHLQAAELLRRLGARGAVADLLGR